MMHKEKLEFKRELEEIKLEVDKIEQEMIEKTPEHFSKQDFLRSFFGALFFGFSFLFSGAALVISEKIPFEHLVMVIFSTLFILTCEIYFIGYSRVKDKEQRKFGQFWVKRLVAFYGIAIVVSFYLSYIYGFLYLVGSFYSLIKLVFIVAMPCAIGAAITDLLRKYLL
jgi:uncharacterized membrane protein